MRPLRSTLRMAWDADSSSAITIFSLSCKTVIGSRRCAAPLVGSGIHSPLLPILTDPAPCAVQNWSRRVRFSTGGRDSTGSAAMGLLLLAFLLMAAFAGGFVFGPQLIVQRHLVGPQNGLHRCHLFVPSSVAALVHFLVDPVEFRARLVKDPVDFDDLRVVQLD